MPKQLISIVLPVFNGAAYLPQAIESCIAQSYRHVELIIVDDCSTDNSLAIARDYEARDSRITVLQHLQNRKLPAALNTGFAAARGEFLTWTSHDNFYSGETLELLLEHLLTHKETGIVYSDFFVVDQSGAVTGEVNLPSPDQLIFRNVVGASFLYRREVYERLGDYDEKLFLAEDYDYWLRAFGNFQFFHIPHSLYYYRDHDQTLTNQKLADVFNALEKALAKFLKDNRSLKKETRNKMRYNLLQLSYAYQRYDKVIGHLFLNMIKSPVYTVSQLTRNRNDIHMLLSSVRKVASLHRD